MACCDFSYRHYSEIVEQAKSAGYQFVSYGEPQNGKAMIIMRHDIDVDPYIAVRLGRLEHSLAISSTYFPLFHSPYYKMDDQNFHHLENLVTMGHHVGLHYDSARSIIFVERKLLEMRLGIKVDVMAQHNPSHDKDSWDKPTDIIDASYLPKDIKYISDSRGVWREGCLCQWIGKAEKIQCNIHPIWWNV